VLDEEVVNVWLIEFFQALTRTIPGLSSEWTPFRQAFRVKFAKDKYEARTDGRLKVKGNKGKIQAIIEVKVRARVDCDQFATRLLVVMDSFLFSWLALFSSPEALFTFHSFDASVCTFLSTCHTQRS
jgi:hypothetical protein